MRISENSPAVWTLNKVGINYARDYAAKLGIQLSDSDVYLPIALGGIQYGVTPLEMADAYQVYASNGKRAKAHAIRRIVNNLDEVIYEPEAPKQTIKESTASQMDEMLRSVVTSGTGTQANIPGYHIMGKTGTNENPDGHGNKDIWFAGFTPNMVGVVWMGFDNTDASHYIPSGQTSYIAAKMFGQIAEDTLKILPQVKQNNDNKIEKVSLDLFRNTEGNQITIKWDDKPGLKYEVYRDGNIIGDSLDGIYTDPSVEAEKSYTYKIVGYNESTGEKVLESNEATIQLPKVVEQPANKGQNNPSTNNPGDSNQATPPNGGNQQGQSQPGDPSQPNANNQPPSDPTKVPPNTNNGATTNPAPNSAQQPNPTSTTSTNSGH
jgi:penicillin-binding protein 2A